MKIIQEHLRQLLQTVLTSKMMQIPLCLDALFEHFKTKFKMSVKKLQCTALIILLKRWMACSSIMEIGPHSLVR